MNKARSMIDVSRCGVTLLLFLAGCAGSTRSDAALDRLGLFTGAGAPRFRVALSCAGQVAAETALCWVPSRYFRQWADARGVPMRTFEAGTGAEAAHGARDVGADYLVVVRFAPIAIGSYSSESDGMGGYQPPQAGYDAEVQVFATRDNTLAAHASYRRKSAAAFKADAVPYVKAGVQAVVRALDPAYADTVD
jgi:hypothetical protein